MGAAFRSKFIPLLLVSTILTLTSCSKDSIETSKKSKGTSESSVVFIAPAAKLEQNVKNFESTINGLRDDGLRKQVIRDYGLTFYNFAKEHSGTESGIEAWCYVLALGTDDTKEEALRTVFEFAEKDLSSPKSVELLGEIYRNGNEHYQSVSLAHLKAISTSNNAGNSIDGLQLLATMKEIPMQARTFAIQHWVDECLHLPETCQVIDRLSEQQCLFSEEWLKKIATCTEGETRAKAIVKLAKYLNRRLCTRVLQRRTAKPV